MIRIWRTTITRTLPTGHYSRSEGPDVDIETIYVHPDDFDLLISLHDQQVEAFSACLAAGLTRDWWYTPGDAGEAAEDGDPMAVKFFKEYDRIIDDGYTDPEYIEVDGSVDWPKLPYGAKVRKQ